MSTTPKDVDAYLATVAEEARATLAELRAAIRAAAPEAEEFISYQIPTYRQNGVLVAFGAAKKHCGFYITSEAVMNAFKAELEPYGTAKTTVQFPFGKPIPVDLVTKLVHARMAENKAAKDRKGK